MEDPTERIREMVREALAEDPKVKNQMLLDRARAIAPEAVEGMTIRQFHGTFRLPAARAASAAQPKPKKPKAKKQRAERAPAPGRSGPAVPTATRDKVRDVFRRFAMELSAAEGRGDIVRVVARIDDFADEAIRQMQGPGGPRGRKVEEPAMEAEPAEPVAVETQPAEEERKRRRRPKAEIEKAAALRAAAEAEAPTERAAPEAAPEPKPDAKKASPLAGLVDDLEAFRRRQSSGQRRHL